MLLPYHSGTSDALETLEHKTLDYVGESGMAEAGAFIPSEPPPIEKRSRVRVQCTRKGCDYREPSTEEMRWVRLAFYFLLWLRLLSDHAAKLCPRKHAASHRRCPKEDCSWADARDGKEKSRHVWYKHRSWAERTGYPR